MSPMKDGPNSNSNHNSSDIQKDPQNSISSETAVSFPAGPLTGAGFLYAPGEKPNPDRFRLTGGTSDTPSVPEPTSWTDTFNSPGVTISG